MKTMGDYFKTQGRVMPVEQAIYLCMQICEGLAYAHDLRNPVTGKLLNIVHRDISPPNVLVFRRGEVKLVDFGLAKVASQVEKIDSGVVKGKFSYLSPEAASGQEVDRRTDVFAVGIILWELLAGKRLFFGETDFQTVELVRKAHVPSLTALNPQVTPDLEEIIRTGLARDVDSRYQSARDFGDALAQYLFTRGLKVTSYDIARLIEEILAYKAAKAVREEPSLIHDLISEELLKFSSIGDNKDGTGKEQPRNPGKDLIDPREWLLDAGETQDPLPAVGGGPPKTAGTSTKPPPPPTAPMGGLADMIEPGRAADFVLMDRAQHSSGKDLLDSVRRGDLPGIGMVVIDGAVRIGRSRNTPPAERVPEIVP
jgi:serine/threonine-protein kinase